jgi:molecular chaperone GrpE
MADDKNASASAKAAESGQKEAGQKPEEQKPQAKPDPCAEIKEQMLRLAAEFDNYKKRTKNDVDRAKGLGKAELIGSMLPILDEFELALIAASSSSDKNLLKGIEMVYSNLTDTLKRAGLREIHTEGIADPFRHEVAMVRESDKKPGTILEVVKKGYMLDDMLLRPASVIVAKEKAER